MRFLAEKEVVRVEEFIRSTWTSPDSLARYSCPSLKPARSLLQGWLIVVNLCPIPFFWGQANMPVDILSTYICIKLSMVCSFEPGDGMRHIVRLEGCDLIICQHDLQG